MLTSGHILQTIASQLTSELTGLSLTFFSGAVPVVNVPASRGVVACETTEEAIAGNYTARLSCLAAARVNLPDVGLTANELCARITVTLSSVLATLAGQPVEQDGGSAIILHHSVGVPELTVEDNAFIMQVNFSLVVQF